MSVREARLPADEPAILSFITGLQDFEAAFEPNRRRDPAFAADHWRDAQHRCAQKHGIMLIAEDAGKAVGWAFAYEEHGELFITEPERRHGFLAEIFVMPAKTGRAGAAINCSPSACWPTMPAPSGPMKARAMPPIR